MADYIELELLDDVEALSQIGFDWMEASIDGYAVRPGNVETVLIESCAQIISEAISQVSQVPPVLFAYLGGTLLNMPIRAAQSSWGPCEITFEADTEPVTLPIGWQIAVAHPSGEEFIFGTTEEIVAPEGGGVVDTTVAAIEAGAMTNGCFGAAEAMEVVDSVTAILVGTTSNGTDGETEDEYLDRLADAATILAPRPILPEDHATLARQVAGVGRALAIDLYIPASTDPKVVGDLDAPEVTGAPQTGVPRATTVVITDLNGGLPSRSLMDEVYARLDGAREVNFLNFVSEPTYTRIAVKVTVQAFPNVAPVAVEDAVLSQLESWLDPFTFNQMEGPNQDAWASDTKARIYEVIDWANRAWGVHFVVDGSVQLQANGGAWSSTDITLAGIGPLPEFDRDASVVTVVLP